MEESITKVLDLVLVTDRHLEPWICDTICDNISSLLTTHRLDEKTSRSLHAVLNQPIYNVKLQLQIMVSVLRLSAVTFHRPYNLSIILDHLEEYPTVVLDVCSLLAPLIFKKDFSGSGKLIFSAKCLEELCVRRGYTTGNNIEFLTMRDTAVISDRCCLSNDDHGIVKLMDKVKQFSNSLNASTYTRKAAVSFIANYCAASSNLDKTADLLKEYSDEVVIDVLAVMFNIDVICKSVAVKLIAEHFSHLAVPSMNEEKSLCKLRAYVACKKLADYQLLSDLKLNYHCTNLYWRSFYQALFCELIPWAGEEKFLEEIVTNICSHQNVDVLAAVFRTVLSEKICEVPVQQFTKVLLSKFVEYSLFQKTVDIIYDDCASLQAQRSALSLINDIIEMDALINSINTSNVCHHHSKCDITDFKCFMSTFLIYLSECSPDSLAALSEISCKLFNLPEFAASCHSLYRDLTKFLIRRLFHGESRVRDLVLDLIRQLNQYLIEPEVVQQILTLSYTDEDFYIKSSCFKVMSECNRQMLPFEVSQAPGINMLNQIIQSIEHDDSMVAISFFGFLQNHFHLVKTLVNENIASILSSTINQQKSTATELSSNQALHRKFDLDSVIDEVCNTHDCSDVSLIVRYQDKKMESDSTPPATRLVRGIFRLLASDRCDVERMKASIDLMTIIICNLSENEKAILVDFLNSDYFSLVESFNSPYLQTSIKKFNSVLGGIRVFPEIEPSKHQNLKTVLSLLESTPDPSIVMDCY